MTKGAAVSVKGLTKIYRGGIKAVNNVSFEVNRGEIFGILGPNGAGKSSVMRIRSTLISMTGGGVSVLGAL